MSREKRASLFTWMYAILATVIGIVTAVLAHI